MYKGKTLNWILDESPSYIVWLYEEASINICHELYNTAELEVQMQNEVYLWGDGDF